MFLGPFNWFQKQHIKEKFQIRIHNIQPALHWLQENNILYCNLALDLDAVIETNFIVFSQQVDSQNANVEKVMEIIALFPNLYQLTMTNEGILFNSDLKKALLENRINRNKSVLISGLQKRLLRDCKGQNLLLEYPIMFPFGIGSTEYNKEEHKGLM